MISIDVGKTLACSRSSFRVVGVRALGGRWRPQVACPAISLARVHPEDVHRKERVDEQARTPFVSVTSRDSKLSC